MGVYYANDRKPWKDAEERTIREELIDNDRCWLKLSDRHNLTDRDYLITKLNYVSDPWLLSDFFDDEYQKNVQPENRVTLTHRGDHYSAGVGLNTRLNDFYGNVNRLPEVFLNFNRQKILDTPFYYEGENTFSYLDRVFPDGAPEEHYDAFRLDTAHMVYWPTRHFGFLSVIPRAGYRGTYYSKTRHISTVTNAVSYTHLDVYKRQVCTAMVCAFRLVAGGNRLVCGAGRRAGGVGQRTDIAARASAGGCRGA